MRLCPCFSLMPYNACCAPFHRGEQEPPTPALMMRSRFAAYGAKEYAYLYRTMHATHEYRAETEEDFIAAVRHASRTRKYLGLTVYDERGVDANGLAKVLFLAKIFDRGVDQSFVECSDFLHDGVGWRYLMCTATTPRTDGLDKTIEKFLMLKIE